MAPLSMAPWINVKKVIAWYVQRSLNIFWFDFKKTRNSAQWLRTSFPLGSLFYKRHVRVNEKPRFAERFFFPKNKTIELRIDLFRIIVLSLLWDLKNYFRVRFSLKWDWKKVLLNRPFLAFLSLSNNPFSIHWTFHFNNNL